MNRQKCNRYQRDFLSLKLTEDKKAIVALSRYGRRQRLLINVFYGYGACR